MPVDADQGPLIGADALPDAPVKVDPTLELEKEVALWKDRAERMKNQRDRKSSLLQAAKAELASACSRFTELQESTRGLIDENKKWTDRMDELDRLEGEMRKAFSEANQLRKRWMSRPISEYIQELEGQVAFHNPGRYPGEPPVLPAGDSDVESPAITDETETRPGGAE